MLTRADSPEAATKIDTAIVQWKSLRAQVCTQPGAAPRLACLDRVLARIDAIRRARLYDPTMSVWGVNAQLIAPEVCLRDDPARLPASYSEAAVIGLALRSGAAIQSATIKRARATLEHDACARAYFGFLDPSAADESKNAAELCGDDQAYGAASLNVLARLNSPLDPDMPKKLHEAERAVERAANPFLTRQFYGFEGIQAVSANDLERAIDLFGRAIGTEHDDLEARFRVFRAAALLARGDLTAAMHDTTALEQRTVEPIDHWAIAAMNATVRWLQGDATAYATLARVTAAARPANPSQVVVRGIVVDSRGRPVAGAEVAAGEDLDGDANGVALALYDSRSFPLDIQRTVTDAAGRFALSNVTPRAIVVAGHGADRSAPVAPGGALHLVLAPTIAIKGHVAASSDHGISIVVAQIDPAYTLVAPVRGDGSYELAVPPGVRVRSRHIEAAALRDGPLGTADLAPPSDRTIDVVARSATSAKIDVAVFTVLAGSAHPATVRELRSAMVATQFASATAQTAIQTTGPVFHRGDVIAHVRGAAPSVITACVQAVQVDSKDPDFWPRYAAHELDQPIQCSTSDATATQVVISVPAMKRID